jgi:hypothetical protein
MGAVSRTGVHFSQPQWKRHPLAHLRWARILAAAKAAFERSLSLVARSGPTRHEAGSVPSPAAAGGRRCVASTCGADVEAGRWTKLGNRVGWRRALRSKKSSGILTDEMAELKYRGRAISESHLLYIREMVTAHPGASRRTLSKKLCEAWQWRQANGALSDMLCRGLLVMLERAGQITLPPVSYVRHNPLARRSMFTVLEPSKIGLRTRPYTRKLTT